MLCSALVREAFRMSDFHHTLPKLPPVKWPKIAKVRREATKEARRQWLVLHLREQRYRCFYCGSLLGSESAGSRKASLDHHYPVSRGGPDTYENTVAACRACNDAKADLLPHEFMAGLKRQPRKGSTREAPRREAGVAR
jgi:5-methylcytosine-specific restriction endonuclease McrA